MAITTYAELQTSMESWLGHTLYTDQLPDFITVFEAAANRRLRTRYQETTATITTSSGAGSLPSDYLAWRRVTWQGSTRVELEWIEPDYLQMSYPTDSQGVPQAFTIEGSTLYARPIDDTASITIDRKSTRLNSSHVSESRMPSSA